MRRRARPQAFLSILVLGSVALRLPRKSSPWMNECGPCLCLRRAVCSAAVVSRAGHVTDHDLGPWGDGQRFSRKMMHAGDQTEQLWRAWCPPGSQAERQRAAMEGRHACGFMLPQQPTGTN
jgi:hypothetical protein